MPLQIDNCNELTHIYKVNNLLIAYLAIQYMSYVLEMIERKQIYVKKRKELFVRVIKSSKNDV